MPELLTRLLELLGERLRLDLEGARPLLAGLLGNRHALFGLGSRCSERLLGALPGRVHGCETLRDLGVLALRVLGGAREVVAQRVALRAQRIRLRPQGLALCRGDLRALQLPAQRVDLARRTNQAIGVRGKGIRRRELDDDTAHHQRVARARKRGQRDGEAGAPPLRPAAGDKGGKLVPRSVAALGEQPRRPGVRRAAAGEGALDLDQGGPGAGGDRGEAEQLEGG